MRPPIVRPVAWRPRAINSCVYRMKSPDLPLTMYGKRSAL
jgi:hypothetical protein